MKTKRLIMLLAVIMLITVCFAFGVNAEERTIIETGNCGANGNKATYTLYDNGELVISGTGAIGLGYTLSYNLDGVYYYNTFVKSITINEGITELVSSSFSNFINLEYVSLPSTIKRISNYSFLGCYNLRFITVNTNNPHFSNDEYGVLFNKGKTELLQYPTGRQASDYYIPNTVTKIHTYAFHYCKYLESIVIPYSVEEFYPISISYSNLPITVTILNPSCRIHETSISYMNGFPIISGYTGSTAEKFALDWQYHFIPLDGENAGTVQNHQFPDDWSTIIPATCSAEGLQIKTCRTCGMSEYSVTTKGDHNFSDWEIVIEADCTRNGLETRMCSTCDKTENSTIYSLGHTYTIDTSKGYDEYVCSVCNYNYSDGFEAPDKPSEPNTPKEPDNKDEEKPCDCDCHKGGIKGFFFKFINFFEKLFGKNKICKCGAKH